MWTIDRVKDELNKLAAADGLAEITVPVEVNARLSTTLGRVRFQNHRPVFIQFSKKLLEQATDEDIIQVIKHEYVHYFLLVTTKENHGHDRMFKNKCAAIGCTHDKTRNEVIFTEDENAGTSTPASKYEVYCPDCDAIVGYYHRRCKTIDNIQNYMCKRCNGHRLIVNQNW